MKNNFFPSIEFGTKTPANFELTDFSFPACHSTDSCFKLFSIFFKTTRLKAFIKNEAWSKSLMITGNCQWDKNAKLVGFVAQFVLMKKKSSRYFMLICTLIFSASDGISCWSFSTNAALLMSKVTKAHLRMMQNRTAGGA